MNKIKNILITLTIGLFALSLFLLPSFVYASVAEFSNTPLFGQANFAPGDSITNRYIKIKNEETESHRAIVNAFDVVNSGGLGDVTKLKITDGSNIFYEGTFSDFFSKTEVVLPQIAAGSSKTFYMIVTFDESAGNVYQNSTMSFSIKAGLDDGDTGTDTTVISSGGSSGSSIVLGSDHLVVSNENSIVTIPQAPATGNTITITWNTNIPATSQVVYGLSSGGPYNLNLSDSKFGYPSSTVEQDLGKVINHTVVLSNLLPGNYSYRVISRASPPTVGYEHYFTVGENKVIPTQNPTNNFIALNREGNTNTGIGGNNRNGEANQGQVLGENTTNPLGAAAGKITNISHFWLYLVISLLILLIIFLFFLWRKKEKEKEDKNTKNNKVDKVQY